MKEKAVEKNTGKKETGKKETWKKETKERGTEKQTVSKQDLNSQPAFRKLEDMNLLDDFLFGSVVTYPEIGERFVKSLLKTIFGREFRHLSVTAQKVLYGADRNLHGARLDVYLEPETGDEPQGRAAVYDIEPDRKDSPEDIRALPRRVRFYHGKIAARSLNSGAEYEELKDVVVIMILPFDPFGLKRMVYTVRNQCVEVPEMEYEDGASTLFLYTQGTEGVPSEALKQFLHYMEDSVYENAVTEELREIHRMVEKVKKDSEVTGMRIQIIDDVIRLQEENARIVEEKDRISEEKDKISEEKDRISEAKDKISEEKDRISKEKDKLLEESAKKTEQITRLTEEAAGKTEQITELAAENAKLAAELIRLQEELAHKA